jgi:UDP-N-acetylmuramyl pentapeptide phosphotransferase/UDP-N-acetylglucosamine-1-phosphate transferase
MYPITFLLLAFFLSFFFVKLIKDKLYPYLLDQPNHRSVHNIPTPRGGGMGFIGSFYTLIIIDFIFTEFKIPDTHLRCLLIIIPLIIIGLVDDWKSLSVSTRYLTQLGVATALVSQSNGFRGFAVASGSIADWLLLGVCVIGTTALINFYNFMDGIDGLVAGIVVIQLSFLSVWANLGYLLLLVFALLGFLCFNWHPAKIFMGDSGSTFLGALIAALILITPKSSPEAWSILTITLPITLDAIFTIFQRLLKRENIFEAHRSHIYQRLILAGLSHAFVSSLYIGLTLLITGLVYRWHGYGALGGMVVALLGLFGAEYYLGNVRSHAEAMVSDG